MIPKLRLLLPLFLMALGQVPVCQAQEITILLLDVRSGRPFANETVSVQFHIAQVADLQTIEVQTGADGAAKIHLPQPTPSKVSVFSVNPNLYPCSSVSPFDTRLVIAEGLVSCCSKLTQGCRCKFGKQVTQLTNSPGKLVLLARPTSWWERVAAHIWE
jgi:hypothetical protein